jgi:hypothetical protein
MAIGRYTLPVSDDNIGSSGIDRNMLELRRIFLTQQGSAKILFDGRIFMVLYLPNKQLDIAERIFDVVNNTSLSVLKKIQDRRRHCSAARYCRPAVTPHVRYP